MDANEENDVYDVGRMWITSQSIVWLPLDVREGSMGGGPVPISRQPNKEGDSRTCSLGHGGGGGKIFRSVKCC